MGRRIFSSPLPIGISRREFVVFGEDITISVLPGLHQKCRCVPRVLLTDMVAAERLMSDHFKAQISPIRIPVWEAYQYAEVAESEVVGKVLHQLPLVVNCQHRQLAV